MSVMPGTTLTVYVAPRLSRCFAVRVAVVRAASRVTVEGTGSRPPFLYSRNVVVLTPVTGSLNLTANVVTGRTVPVGLFRVTVGLVPSTTKGRHSDVAVTLPAASRVE